MVYYCYTHIIWVTTMFFPNFSPDIFCALHGNDFRKASTNPEARGFSWIGYMSTLCSMGINGLNGAFFVGEIPGLVCENPNDQCFSVDFQFFFSPTSHQEYIFHDFLHLWNLSYCCYSQEENSKIFRDLYHQCVLWMRWFPISYYIIGSYQK